MKKNFYEEQKLVTFLKQYRPAPPATNIHIEEQLLAIVSQERLSKSSNWLWVIPGAIATGLLLIYGSLIRDNFVLKIAKQTEDLEAFMVNSWQGSMDDNQELNEIYNLETDWLMLTKTQISSAQP